MEKEEELQLAPENIEELLEENYFVVEWPEIQSYMDHESFRKEALLLNTEEQLRIYGSSAYLLPKSLSHSKSVD